MATKIQFILKTRINKYLNEEVEEKQLLSSGLFNSANFMRQMLADDGFDTDIVHAVDNNEIDRLVTRFKPDICIIEAFWVVPEKFEILHKLHPKIKWVIRNHSALPFMANEGMAMDWSLRYMNYNNVFLCSNDIRAHNEISSIAKSAGLSGRYFYLPNFYPYDFTPREQPVITDTINIACFGAMRPLKNHLIQAAAAIKYADKHNLKLRFHVNGTRIEMKGEPIVHNLQKTFNKFSDKHELVEHPWLSHSDFIKLIREMDVCIQVSYTETFNIVSADAAINDVPIVVSPDIKWSNYLSYADPNDSDSIVSAIERVLVRPDVRIANVDGIKQFSETSRKIWNDTIPKILGL